MTKYVIIGDGAAGTTGAQYIRQQDAKATIQIYADDPNPAYFRAALTNYLIGELREDQIWAVPATFYADHQIDRILARVSRVDPIRKEIALTNGQQVPYDKLLLATGAQARQPTFKGGDLPGVMTMRTLQDVRQVMDLIKLHGLKEAVIVGGGPLALEWVQGLHERDVKVHYLLRSKRLMGRVLDKTASDLTLARMRLAGVNVLTEEEIEEAVPGKDGAVQAIRTKKGTTIQCQLVGVAIGVVCTPNFLTGSGIALDRKNGIVVNGRMESSLPDIYAAGDSASFEGDLLQLWEPARQQGRVAGLNMSGGKAAYRPGVHYNATRLYDLDFASVGDISGGDGIEEKVEFPQGSDRLSYRKLWFRENRLIGALMLGRRQERVRGVGRQFKKLIDEQVDLSDVKERLLVPGFDLAGWQRKNQLWHKPDLKATGALSGSGGSSGAKLDLSPAKLRQTIRLDKLPQEQLGLLKKELSGGIGFLQRQGSDEKVAIGAGIKVGRLGTNDLVIDTDPGVSGTHAQIRREGNRYYLADLGSRNGTFLNDEQISGAVPLQGKQLIRFGKSAYQFILEEEKGMGTAVAPAAPVAEAAFIPSIGMGTQQLQRPILTETNLPYLMVGAQKFLLERTVVMIGDGPDNEVSFNGKGLSEKHAQISRQPSGYYLQDLGSRTGSRVNEQLVVAPHLLEHGDQIELGELTLTIHFSDKPVPKRKKVEEQVYDWPTLLIFSDHALGVEFALTKASLVVGRSPEVDVHLVEPSISWRHATFSRDDSSCWVVDLQSSNGTYINGKKLVPNGEWRLSDKDIIHFGKVKAQFRLPEQLREMVIEDEPQKQVTLNKQCIHCGAGMKETARFCPDCGRAQKEREKTTMLSQAEMLAALAKEEKEEKKVQGDPISKKARSEAQTDKLVLPDTDRLVAEEEVARADVKPIKGRLFWAEEEVTIMVGGWSTIIGRDETISPMQLENEFVSGRHIEIREDVEGSFWVRDLGSRNGSNLNGRSLGIQFIPLESGHELQLGSQIKLRFEVI